MTGKLKEAIQETVKEIRQRAFECDLKVKVITEEEYRKSMKKIVRLCDHIEELVDPKPREIV